MVKLRTHTPFSGAAFQKYNARQELTVTVTTVAAFHVQTDGSLQKAASQPEMRLSDVYADPGQPNARLLEVSDFVPFRPATDVVVLGDARSPRGAPSAQWPVSLTIGPLSENLVVHGPRYWQKQENGPWQITPAQEVTSVPLDWRLSAGGPYLVPEEAPEYGDVNIWNPVGPGVIVPGTTSQKYRYPAPQIVGADAPVTTPDDAVIPRNLGPVAPVWRSREQHAGSYDQTWLETQHPFLPPDFNPTFYNAAPPALQAHPFLRGDETVTLSGVDHDADKISFSLPSLAFGAVVTHDNGLTVRQPMNLDFVELDWRQETRALRLCWRSAFPWRDGIATADIGELLFETLFPTGDPQNAAGQNAAG